MVYQNGSEKRTKGKESKVKENSTSSPYVEEAHAAKPLRNAGARDEAVSVAPSAGGGSKDKSDFDLAAFARYFNETMAAHGAQIPTSARHSAQQQARCVCPRTAERTRQRGARQSGAERRKAQFLQRRRQPADGWPISIGCFARRTSCAS